MLEFVVELLLDGREVVGRECRQVDCSRGASAVYAEGGGEGERRTLLGLGTFFGRHGR